MTECRCAEIGTQVLRAFSDAYAETGQQRPVVLRLLCECGHEARLRLEAQVVASVPALEMGEC